MKYNFDEVIDRSSNRSAKYDERAKKFGTDKVIPLWIADMDFKTAQPIIDACVERAQQGIWGYVSRPASYFEAIADWEEKYYGWRPDTALMSWCMGVVPSMAALMKIYTMPGDSILMQPPVYSEFYEIPEGIGRHPVENRLIEKDGRWSIDFEDFEKKAAQCKLFILCSPHNPLGMVWSVEELRRMVEICLKYNVLVVSDEIHSDLVFHGKKHTRTALVSEEARRNVITCISNSKTFNLAGMQASTVIFPNSSMKRDFDNYWYRMDIHRNNAFSTVAVEAGYRYGREWLEQLLEYLSGNFDFIADYCKNNIPAIKPNIPDSTYLVWLDCRELKMSNEELKKFMVEKAGLGLNDGASFIRGLDGYMRLNAACPRSVLKTALEQLKEAVDKL